MTIRASLTVLATLLLLTITVDTVSAQDECFVWAQNRDPSWEILTIMFHGSVTVDGAPSQPGRHITARIGEEWESDPVTVGKSPCTSDEFAWLVVSPEMGHELYVGSSIEFWLDGQVKAANNNWFAPLPEVQGEGIHGQWTFPIPRRVDLEFPAVPDGYRLDGTLPATGGASLGKPMLAAFLLIGLLATISGFVAARRRSPKTTISSP